MHRKGTVLVIKGTVLHNHVVMKIALSGKFSLERICLGSWFHWFCSV